MVEAQNLHPILQPTWELHQHTFDHITIGQSEKIFPGTINGRNLVIYHFQNGYGIIRQFFFQAFRQISRLIPGRDQMLMQPAIDLLCPKRLLL